MAGTSIVDVTDLFMTLQQDYRLISLYTTSGSAALTDYLEAWLLFSIQEFTPVCNQSLTYTSGSVQEFTETLNTENQLILAQIMIKYWLKKTVQDTLQMNNSLQDHDYKSFSQAQNLKAKQDFYNVVVEQVGQTLNEYAYRNNNWVDWLNQEFYVP
jgi:hypothetical protein